MRPGAISKLDTQSPIQAEGEFVEVVVEMLVLDAALENPNNHRLSRAATSSRNHSSSAWKDLAPERARSFLRYVAGETLAGHADRLKGYSIAVAVFERDENFDSQVSGRPDRGRAAAPRARALLSCLRPSRPPFGSRSLRAAISRLSPAAPRRPRWRGLWTTVTEHSFRRHLPLARSARGSRTSHSLVAATEAQPFDIVFRTDL